jgi:hypothetical protein
MSDTVTNDPIYLNPSNVLSAGQSALHPEGGYIPPPKEDETPGTTKLIGELEQSQREGEAEHERSKAWREGAYSRLHQIERQRPAIPNQQQLGPPPDAREYHKHSMAWAGAMAMIGAVSAKAGRMSGTQALDSFSGAMKGWQEGNLQAYMEAAQNWKDQNYRTLENNRQLLEKYQMVMDNHRMNIDQQLAEIQRISVEERDNMTYRLVQDRNWTAIAQLQDNRYQVNNSAEAKSKFFADQVDMGNNQMRLLAQHWAPYAGPNGENLDQDRQLSNQQKETIKFALRTFPSGQDYTSGGMLTPLTLQEMVDRRLSGDKSVVTNIGRGAQGGQNIAAFNNALGAEMQRRGITGEQLAKIDQEFIARQRGMSAEEGAVGQRAGAIGIAVQEARDTIPNVRSLAEISAGRGYATWDAVESRWKMQKGDRNFATYVQQLNSLVNIYGRVLSGGGRGAVTDREHAREMLNPNMPLSAVEGSLDGFERELGIAQEAPGKIRGRMHGEGPAPAGGGRGNLPAGATTSGRTEGQYSSSSDEELKQKLGLP